MKNALIEISGVGMRFDTVDALHNISLAVERKRFVSIVGPSGCGKSTLMRIVAGLVRPTSGEVRIEGETVHRPHPGVGIVFQSATLLPWKSVRGNIALQLELRGLKPSEHAAAIDGLIRLTGLQGFENHLPHQLSGGMQQRVSICRALVHDPELLLLDEPFGALDAMTRETMNLELQRIWLDRRKTVLMITHGIAEAVFLSDIVVVMSARPGRIERIIEIDLERPRRPDIDDDPRFREYVKDIRKMFGEALALD
ncbi:NitT/TauT family transport system ATP-binding protein [Rhodoligotrophos appendicifer]|uniref:ABC transporter ATP-binding protein n=1 Tax=Rhodoligotrophos appendicifer TaxID=987056 RepID=UPI0011867571|nr:ABC transporter ATP-binding protein [Rhodoligotrophos appendicifer]